MALPWSANPVWDGVSICMYSCIRVWLLVLATSGTLDPELLPVIHSVADPSCWQIAETNTLAEGLPIEA